MSRATAANDGCFRFAYIITMILSLLRICDLNYTRNSEIQYLLDEREEILKLELKIQEQELQSQPRSPGPALRPPIADHNINQDEEASIFSSMTRPTAVHTSSSSSSGSSLPSLSRYMGDSLPSIPEASSSSSIVPASSISAQTAMPVSPTEMYADLAMITDGSRYTPSHLQADNNQLPAYSPGNQRTMSGHGDESNNIRLSDYVKGETRAQDMKDGGSYQ